MARNTEGGVRVRGVRGSGRDARLRAEDDLDVVGLRLQSRGSSRDSLWAHSLGDRRRRAPVVLSTLPPALVARLLIAPARSSCISKLVCYARNRSSRRSFRRIRDININDDGGRRYHHIHCGDWHVGYVGKC